MREADSTGCWVGGSRCHRILFFFAEAVDQRVNGLGDDHAAATEFDGFDLAAQAHVCDLSAGDSAEHVGCAVHAHQQPIVFVFPMRGNIWEGISTHGDTVARLHAWRYSYVQPIPGWPLVATVSRMHAYSHTFRRRVAMGRVASRPWRIRRERSLISVLEDYGLDVAVSIEVRRERFAEWVQRVLAQAWQQRQLSVPKIAELAKIGSNTIYRWRDGNWKEGPKPEQVVAFCDALDIPPAAAFTILWPGKTEAPAPTEPMVTDPDLALLMRKLMDPNVPEYEKYFIRESLRQLADRPDRPQTQPGRTPNRRRPRTAS